MRCGTRSALCGLALALYWLLRVFSAEEETVKQLKQQNKNLVSQLAHLSEELAESQHLAADSKRINERKNATANLQQNALLHTRQVRPRKRCRPVPRHLLHAVRLRQETSPETKASNGLAKLQDNIDLGTKSRHDMLDAATEQVSEPANAHHDTPPVLSGTCSTYEDQDLPGWDLSDLSSASPETCCDACTGASTRCAASDRSSHVALKISLRRYAATCADVGWRCCVGGVAT